MGIYGERILPRIINVACGMKTVEPLRSGSARVLRETSLRSVSAQDPTCRSIPPLSPGLPRSSRQT
jgi:hypothetical protein